MKIVINSDFGGFGLSTEAMKTLIARDCKAIEVVSEEEYTGGKGRFQKENYRKDKDGYEVGWIEDVLFKDGKVYSYDKSIRTDPDLITIVEEMGKKASGEYGSLEIIEIPDGTEWEISEYDGSETVHEKHRSWR